jgi:hypothetical protein
MRFGRFKHATKQTVFLPRQQVDDGTGFEEKRSTQEKNVHRKSDIDVSLFKVNTPNLCVRNVHGHSLRKF